MIKFKYIVYGKHHVSDESLIIVGFNDLKTAEEYVDFLKSKNPCGRYYIGNIDLEGGKNYEKI